MIIFPKEEYEKMLMQAKREFPYECCGLVAGRIEEGKVLIEKIYEMTNTDQSSEHFSMDPKEQFAAVKDMRKEGLVLLGNYHSHPYTPSRPSEEDKKLAYDPKALYGIVSLEKEEPVFNFFHIDEEKNVEKLEYQVV